MHLLCNSPQLVFLLHWCMSAFRPSGPFEEHPDVAEALGFVHDVDAQGAVVPMFFLPEASIRFESWAFAYRTRLPKEMVLLQPAKKQLLRGTVLLGSSSGVLRLTLRDGTTMHEALKRSRSVRRVTIEIPTNAHGAQLEWLTSDGAVSSFVEGHCYRIHFFGAPPEFSVEHARNTARAYKLAHPEVRWADEYADPNSKEAHREREDLARIAVPPSPWPYEDAPWHQPSDKPVSQQR
jgi:hypothetical protein